MWLSRLPDPQYSQTPDEVPSFSENILFTEKINSKYNYPEHRSPFGLLTVLEGSGRFAINRKTETLDRQKFTVINTNSRLAMHLNQQQSNPALLFFQAHLPGILATSLSKTDEQLLDDPYTVQPIDFALLERAHPMNDSLRSRLVLLTQLGGGSSSFAALKADGIVRSILEEMVVKNKLANHESLHLPVKKISTRIELYKRMCLVKEWIEDNYHQALTLEELATIACMNSQHFLRIFKKLFHCTPHQYIIQTRLENAKRMLLTTEDTVHTICRNTGLESLSSFSWLFKQRFGMAPSEFRKQ